MYMHFIFSKPLTIIKDKGETRTYRKVLEHFHKVKFLYEYFVFPEKLYISTFPTGRKLVCLYVCVLRTPSRNAFSNKMMLYKNNVCLRR